MNDKYRVIETSFMGEMWWNVIAPDAPFATDEIDVTLALFESKIGAEILIRSGIPPENFKNFIYSERAPIMSSSLADAPVSF